MEWLNSTFSTLSCFQLFSFCNKRFYFFCTLLKTGLLPKIFPLPIPSFILTCSINLIVSYFLFRFIILSYIFLSYSCYNFIIFSLSILICKRVFIIRYVIYISKNIFYCFIIKKCFKKLR